MIEPDGSGKPAVSKREEVLRLLERAGLEPDQYHLQEPLLTTGQVALVLRTTPRTIRNWADAGRIGAVRTLGGRRLFPLSAVQAALDSMVRDRDRASTGLRD